VIRPTMRLRRIASVNMLAMTIVENVDGCAPVRIGHQRGKSMSSSIERLPSCRQILRIPVLRRHFDGCGRPLNTDPPEVFRSQPRHPDTPIWIVRFHPQQ